MSVEKILEGIMRLPFPIQKRLLRSLRQSTRNGATRKPIPRWRIRRDPIFYTWLERLNQLPLEGRQQLMQQLQSLMKKSEDESSHVAVRTMLASSMVSRLWNFSVAYEDFVEARREVWRQWVRGSE
ncbi:hypothetical protein HRbin15_02068 [bacterium HR15]|nr:hypothetical protein HRbin15_02068 [bacterium HR15]